MVHISEEQLKKILEVHGDWLASEGKEGKQAYLYEANLQRADLKRADLRGADLREADLDGANLCGADLTNTIGLTKKQVESATIDEKTRLPDYL